jgi:uncharacterized protein (TIGR03086 family)
MSRRETVLLADAIRYALGIAALIDDCHLAASTPCPGWDLDNLLRHLAESIAVLDQAMTGLPPPPTGAIDPVDVLRDRAAGLLWTAFTAEEQTDRGLLPVIAVGAIEISVHAWDMGVARAIPSGIPAALARPLLGLSVLVTPERAGLFGPPWPVPARASPGDKLVAWLGRDPAISYPRVA